MVGDKPISPFWSPSRHLDRRPFLRARGRLPEQYGAFSPSRGSWRSKPPSSRSRRAMKPICTPPNRADAAGRQPCQPLSADFAGIRLQEAAGGGRNAHFRVRPCVPRPRARRPASARIHHAGMVPGRRPLRRHHGRYRGGHRQRGAGHRHRHLLVPWPDRRSFRRARAADGRGGLRPVRRNRPAVDNLRQRG